MDIANNIRQPRQITTGTMTSILETRNMTVSIMQDHGLNVVTTSRYATARGTEYLVSRAELGLGGI